MGTGRIKFGIDRSPEMHGGKGLLCTRTFVLYDTSVRSVPKGLILLSNHHTRFVMRNHSKEAPKLERLEAKFGTS